MHSFTMVAEEGEAPIPTFTRHFRLTPHQTGKRHVVVDMAQRAAFFTDQLGDIIADAGYGQYMEITSGLRRAGYNPVFDLSPNHLGLTGAVGGAIVVDGGLYSPGMPEALHDLKPPAVGSNIDQIDHYQQLIAERQRYALRRIGSGPARDGTVRYQCPAAAGRVACPVKPDTLGIATSKGMIVPTQVPSEDAQGDICRQNTITIDLNHPDANTRAMGYIGGLYQKHPFGSDAHYDSINRRNKVESSYSNIKDEAEQNLRRPNIRVMGRTKITLWALWVIMAANIRMKKIWQHRQLLAEQKCGLHHGPVISDAMKAAADAKRRAERRRQRQQEQKAARARGRPPD